MIIVDELLTQVTEDDRHIIGPIPRKAVHGNPALIHRAVHVLVLSTEGKLLLQKRSLNKDVQPGRWDTSVGGHVSFGQEYEAAARREAQEEIGIELRNLKFLYSSKIRNEIESENIWTYLTHSDGPFTPEAAEIDELRFWSKIEIENALGQGLFTSNFEVEYRAFIQCKEGSLLK